MQLIAIDSSFMRCMQVSDAVELASSLRVQLVRERKQADTRSHEAHTAMALADERARALQRQLEALSRANGAAQGGAAQDARAAVASEMEAVPPLPALKSDVGSCADLDKRLAQIKAKHAAAPSFALPIAPPPAPKGAAEAAALKAAPAAASSKQAARRLSMIKLARKGAEEEEEEEDEEGSEDEEEEEEEEEDEEGSEDEEEEEEEEEEDSDVDWEETEEAQMVTSKRERSKAKEAAPVPVLELGLRPRRGGRRSADQAEDAGDKTAPPDEKGAPAEVGGSGLTKLEASSAANQGASQPTPPNARPFAQMQSKEAGDAGEIELTSLENVKGAAAAKKLGAKPRAPVTAPSAATAAKPRAALGRVDGNAAGADVAGGFSKAVTKPASAKGEAGGTRKLLSSTQVVSVNLVDNE